MIRYKSTTAILNIQVYLFINRITTNSEEFNSLYKIDDCEDKAMTDNINDKDDTYDQTKTENESNISAKLYDGSSGDSHCTDIKQEEEHIENEEHQSNHVKEDSDKMADVTEEMIMSEIKPEFMDDVLSGNIHLIS